jgi:uncharacterized membrane protein
MIETHKRTFVRTVTYRIIALFITALWTGLGTAVLIHLVLTAVHYGHERLWLAIKWGEITKAISAD